MLHPNVETLYEVEQMNKKVELKKRTHCTSRAFLLKGKGAD